MRDRESTEHRAQSRELFFFKKEKRKKERRNLPFALVLHFVNIKPRARAKRTNERERHGEELYPVSFERERAATNNARKKKIAYKASGVREEPQSEEVFFVFVRVPLVCVVVILVIQRWKEVRRFEIRR